MSDRPRIAITLGDPRGIGAEIAAKVLAEPPAGAEYVAIGPEALLAAIPGEHIVVGNGDGTRSIPPGHPSRFTLPLEPAAAGRAVGAQIEKAAALALAGEIQAIVTGPAEKHALHLAGHTYPGHTEWLAALAGNVEVVMMLASHRLRVAMVTTHVALRKVPDLLTTERVIRVGEITRDALTDGWGIAQPRLAVCAVNPHAGEGGLFGSEDATIMEPAATALGAAGPLPADTVFVRAMRGEFDAVIAPYHDVGMTAVKVAEFGRSVNVTLGLPFVRTAPDHGTAFDIAGRGVADASSLREAVTLAIRLVTKGAGITASRS